MTHEEETRAEMLRSERASGSPRQIGRSSISEGQNITVVYCFSDGTVAARKQTASGLTKGNGFLAQQAFLVMEIHPADDAETFGTPPKVLFTKYRGDLSEIMQSAVKAFMSVPENEATLRRIFPERQD